MACTEMAVSQAAEILLKGEAVVFPTDTVYGVGVSVYAAKTPEILYDLKQREQRKPIAWLVSSIDDLTHYGKDVPEFAQVLARTFWPGSLTLIVRASEEVPQAFRSKDDTIGLRMPRNDTALALIEAVGSPLATTSANRAGEPPARTGDDLDPDFIKCVGYVLTEDEDSAQGEAAASGVASTILDCTGDHPRLMREGAITISDIRAHC